MEDRYYSTGQAATELGVSQAQVRALCESGAIETVVTPGGQWRISKSVVDRLRTQGLPVIPRPLPGADRRPSSNGTNGHPALYAAPSDKVVDAAEEVVVLANEVKALGLRKQKEEALDWFRQRELEERAEREERERHERAIRAEEAARSERLEWLRSWEEYALDRLPYDCPAEVRLQVHEAVRARLAPLDPVPSSDGSRRIVDAVVDQLIDEWKRDCKIEEIVIEARDRMLPSAARGSWGEITVWQFNAVKAAAAAIRELREDAPIEEIRAAAIRAVQAVTADFEAEKAAKEDAEMRQRVVHRAMPSWIPPQGREIVEKLIEQVIAALPVGTPQAKVEQECERVLADFAAARRQLQADQEAEAKAKEQQHVQRDVVSTSSKAEPQTATGEGPEPIRHQPPRVIRRATADPEPFRHRPPVVTRRAPRPGAGPEPFRHRPPVINR